MAVSKSGAAARPIQSVAQPTLRYFSATPSKAQSGENLTQGKRAKSILKGTIRQMVFILYAAKTQYFKAKMGPPRKNVRPLQKRADERSRRPLLYILKNQQR